MSKLGLFLIGVLFGLIIYDCIVIINCDYANEIYTIFGSNYNCEK